MTPTLWINGYFEVESSFTIKHINQEGLGRVVGKYSCEIFIVTVIYLESTNTFLMAWLLAKLSQKGFFLGVFPYRLKTAKKNLL